MEGRGREIAQANAAPIVQVHGYEQEEEGSQTEVNNLSDSLVIKVKERFNSPEYIKGRPSKNVCIYRVPIVFMEGKPGAYVPKVVSFGPFYHNKHEKLSAMEDQKLLAMKDHKLEAIQRTLRRQGMSMEDLIRVVRNSEKEIRDFYEDSAIEWKLETLVCMMTMDACFILEFFRASEGKRDHDLVFKSLDCHNALSYGILMDILKLENQIPLFLLIRILEFRSSEDAVMVLCDMLCGFQIFRGYPFVLESELALQKEKEIKERLEKHIRGDARHLLDLCSKVTTDFLIVSNDNPQLSDSTATVDYIAGDEDGNPQLSDSTATDDYIAISGDEDGTSEGCISHAELLHKVGIQFKPKNAEGKMGLEKICFARSILSLPPITMDDNTETVLRNLIAFEDCHKFHGHNLLSQYICLMCNLINSEKDVALLTKEGIIINYVGSEKVVADIFNSIHRGIILGSEGGPFTKVTEDVKKLYNARRRSPVHKTINGVYEFIEEHPLYTVSLPWAILIFGMTAVQTVYSVKNN